MKQTLTVIIVFLALLGVANALVTVDEGVTFGTSFVNYSVPPGGITDAESLDIGPNCFNITGGVYNGSYCFSYTTITPTAYSNAGTTLQLNVSKFGTVENISVELWYNGTNQTGITTFDSFSYILFSKTLTAPNVTVDTNVSLYWLVSFDQPYAGTTTVNATDNQTVIAWQNTSCLEYPILIVNYSIYDEETRINNNLTNSSIEVDLSIFDYLGFNWSHHTNTTDNLSICVPDGLLSEFDLYLDTVVRYKADDHATEFNYYDDFPLVINNSQQIYLYTLNTDTNLVEYSTSFLFNYLDEYYLPESGAIIDLLRYYIGAGEYVSVEHGRTDDDGNTVLHLVTEDVIYRIIVRVNNSIVYASNDFTAICLETPCQAFFQEESSANEIDDYTKEENLNYLFDFDYPTRTISLSFSTDDGAIETILFNVTQYDAFMNESICSTEVSLSTGEIVCTIPATARNTTYIAELYRSSDYNFVAYRTFSLSPDAFETFGYTGVMLTFLLYISLVMMAIPSGPIAVLVFGVLGLVTAGFLVIFNIGSTFALGSAIVWLCIAIGLVLWKANKRRG